MLAKRLKVWAGTSIGALIGGLYAREGDIISSSGRAKQFSGRMGNIWRMLSDVTYPIVAYTTVRHNSVLLPRRSHSRKFYRAMSLIAQYTRSAHNVYLSDVITELSDRRSMTCTSRTCGYHSSATPQISTRLGWKFMKRATRGGSSVSVPSSPDRTVTPHVALRCFDDTCRLTPALMRQWKHAG